MSDDMQFMHKLDKKIIYVWLTHNFIELLILSGLYALAESCSEGLFIDIFYVRIIFVFLAVCIVVLAMIAGTILNYQFSRYGLKTDCVEIKRGAFIQRTSLILLIRVQHVKYEQGPIMKMFGLTQITITTAGDSFDIAGISTNEAREFSEMVVAAAELAREDL